MDLNNTAAISSPVEAASATPLVENNTSATADVVPAVTDAAPPAEAAPKVEDSAPTTLLTEVVSEPVQNTEPQVAEPVKSEEPSQSAEPAPLPSYEAFKLPEGVQADAEVMDAFTNKLADLQVKSKAEQALLQEFGQELVNMHVAEVQKTIERAQKAQLDAFEKVKDGWRQQFRDDPEIGQNRQQTTLESARRIISDHGGNAEQQASFRELLDKTGIGNHPAMIRFLANVAQSYREPSPVPAQAPIQTQPQLKTQRLYGGRSA